MLLNGLGIGIAWVDSTSSSTSIGACLSFDLPTYQRAGFLHALIYGKIELVPTSETSKKSPNVYKVAQK